MERRHIKTYFILLLLSFGLVACGTENAEQFDDTADAGTDLVEVDLDGELGSIPPLHSPEVELDDLAKYFITQAEYIESFENFKQSAFDVTLETNVIVDGRLVTDIMEPLGYGPSDFRISHGWRRSQHQSATSAIRRNNRVTENGVSISSEGNWLVNSSAALQTVWYYAVIHDMDGNYIAIVNIPTEVYGIPKFAWIDAGSVVAVEHSISEPGGGEEENPEEEGEESGGSSGHLQFQY